VVRLPNLSYSLSGSARTETQHARKCPFLSIATAQETKCIKSESSIGICTISSSSNGPRQDWLVCPYRALGDPLFKEVAQRLFHPSDNQNLAIVSAPSLADQRTRQAISETAAAGGLIIAYFQDKVGGEISLSKTDRSPELSFDTTMVEPRRERDDFWTVGRYGILEVQTIDFHGSYKAASANLKHALHLHNTEFPAVLQQNSAWLSEKIEGPNIANVFKRTFYQMMLKFKIGEHQPCAGCVLAIPAPVWDSWQRHLGKPELSRRDGDIFVLRGESTWADPPAWIYVFDVDADSSEHPNPLTIKMRIGTAAESLAHYALKVVPGAALEAGGSVDRVLVTLHTRLSRWWPVFSSKPQTSGDLFSRPKLPK
jgi:hypothetical protein